MGEKPYYKPQTEDYTLTQQVALPDAAEGAVNSEVFFAGAGIEKADLDIILSVPELATAVIPDTKTLTLEIKSASNEDFDADVTVEKSITLTGAGGAGVAETEIRMRPTPSGNSYFRATATLGADTTDASASKMTFKPAWD